MIFDIKNSLINRHKAADLIMKFNLNRTKVADEPLSNIIDKIAFNKMCSDTARSASLAKCKELLFK